MKNFILALVVILVCATSPTYGSECSNGTCVLSNVVRKSVSVARDVVSVPVNVTRNVVVKTRNVIKSQPVRSRLHRRCATR